MSGPVRFLLALLLATATVPGAAAAGDRTELTDMLALAYLGSKIEMSCSFAEDDRGNLLRSAASYYQDRTETIVQDQMSEGEFVTVSREAHAKSEAMLQRLIGADEEPSGPNDAQAAPASQASQAAPAWCIRKGGAAIELIAHMLRIEQQPAQKKLVAGAN